MTSHPDTNGLLLTSTSKDCIGLYDKCCLQFLATNSQALDTIQQALKIDESFVMGHVIKTIMDSSKENLKEMNDAVSSITTERERKHVEATNANATGNYLRAIDVWEDILRKHPTDILALRMVNETYFNLGDLVNVRDSVARVFNDWKLTLSSSAQYGFVLGMYAFGLEETNFYREAEKMGREAQQRNPEDIWGCHSVTHVLEMECRIREGIEWNETTRKGWDTAALARHVHWHSALFNMELEHYDKVLHIFDTDVKKQLDLVDASSLLFRCEMAGVDVGDRWEPVYAKWAKCIDSHVLTFNDLHHVMCALGTKKPEAVSRVIECIREYASINGTNKDIQQGAIAASVGVPVAEAMVDFYNHNYEDAKLKLYNVRSNIQQLGGSHAQRDVWNLMLINSALASKDYHQAKALLSERVQLKPASVQTWKMYGLALEGLGQDTSTARSNYQEYLKKNTNCLDKEFVLTPSK